MGLVKRRQKKKNKNTKNKGKPDLPPTAPPGLKGWAKFSKRLGVKERRNAEGWREVLGHKIESHYVQLAVLALIVIDLLVITTEIFLEEHFGRGCDPHPPHAVETVEVALHWISIAILILLGFETIFLLLAFGLEFFTHPMYVLDALIISASLTLEIVFHDSDVGGLLVVLRLWRILRIAHGITLVEEERAHEHIKKAKKELAKVKEDKRKLKHQLSLLQGKDPEEAQHEHDEQEEIDTMEDEAENYEGSGGEEEEEGEEVEVIEEGKELEDLEKGERMERGEETGGSRG